VAGAAASALVSTRRRAGRVPGRPRGIERVEREVLVVSIDRLVQVLRSDGAIDRIAAEGPVRPGGIVGWRERFG
jgi:hypothetical protein